MTKVQHFIVWVCKHFNREQILNIVDELIQVLNDKNPDLKPKDDFKDQHPNYRKFYSGPLAPLDAVDIIVFINRYQNLNRTLIIDYIL